MIEQARIAEEKMKDESKSHLPYLNSFLIFSTCIQRKAGILIFQWCDIKPEPGLLGCTSNYL